MKKGFIIAAVVLVSLGIILFVAALVVAVGQYSAGLGDLADSDYHQQLSADLDLWGRWKLAILWHFCRCRCVFSRSWVDTWIRIS